MGSFTKKLMLTSQLIDMLQPSLLSAGSHSTARIKFLDFPQSRRKNPLTVSDTTTVLVVFSPLHRYFNLSSYMAALSSHETVSSSAECSRDKPPFSFVSGQDSTMWDIVWVSPQGHRSVSVSRHFLLQAPQCPRSVQKRFSRDHCCRGRSKPGCRIVGSHTR